MLALMVFRMPATLARIVARRSLFLICTTSHPRAPGRRVATRGMDHEDAHEHW